MYVSWHVSVSARVTSPPVPPSLFQIPVSPFVLSFHYPRNCHCRYLDAILQHSFSRSFSPTLHVSSTLPAYLSHLPSFHFIIRLSSPWSFRSLYRCLSVLTLGLRLSHSLAVCFVTILYLSTRAFAFRDFWRLRDCGRSHGRQEVLSTSGGVTMLFLCYN